MSSILRINHFVESANRAFDSGTPHYLCASVDSLGVRQSSLPRSWSEETRSENRQTWKIFRESLMDTIGQGKFDWICHRYRSCMNFAQLERTGEPLLPDHVELFSIGSGQVMSRNIKARFPEKLKTLSREQLEGRIQQVQPFPLVGSYRNPKEITGAPGTTIAYFFHDKKLMDKEKQLLFSDVRSLTYPAWLERMSKVVVNRELIEGQLIPAPGADGRIDYYKVYRKIATGDGLVAYAMKPVAADTTLRPLVIFRPSQWAFSNEDCFETYLNDVQHHVGEKGWKAASEHLDRLMGDSHFRRDHQKISIAGYSLGGAHAQYFLAAHADHISHAVFYNDPGVDTQTAEQLAERLNQAPRRSEPLNIQIFRMKGDFCHYVGSKHVGWGIRHPDVNIQLLEVDHENKQVAAFTLHAHRIFDNTIFPYRMDCVEDEGRLFNLLDNTKRGADVYWYEKIRLVWGKAAFMAIYTISKLIALISWFFGVQILRSSKDPSI